MADGASNNPRKVLAQIAAETAKDNAAAEGDAATSSPTTTSSSDAAPQPSPSAPQTADNPSDTEPAPSQPTTQPTTTPSSPQTDNASSDTAPATPEAPETTPGTATPPSPSPSLSTPSQPVADSSFTTPSTSAETQSPSNSGPLASGEITPSGSLTGKPTQRITDKRIKPANDERIRKQRRKHRLKIARNVTIIVVLLAVICAFAGFWMFRWSIYDDATDLQGTWRISGTNTLVHIDGERFILTDEIAYDYAIDPEAKTVSFEFGALDGTARYRFSIDRNQLAVEDGEFDWFSTLSQDIPWTFDALLEALKGTGVKSPGFAEGGMVLERVE